MNAKTLLFTLATLGLGALGASGCIIVSDDDDPDLFTYELCSDDLDCPGRDSCFSITFDTGSRVVTDNMCTRGCTDDFDCPFGGGCYEVAGSSRAICYERCVDDFDCPVGFGCIETFGGARDFICLPE